MTDRVRMVPGLRHVSGGGRNVTVVGRFGRTCGLFVDGVYVLGGLGQEWVAPASVRAIEVYPGSVAPVRYGREGCVIAVWTGL